MLDHLEREHGIEALLSRGQGIEGIRAVVHRHAALPGMIARDLERSGVGIDPRDLESEPRQRLGDQPAAAADIEQPQTPERLTRLGIAFEMTADSIPDKGEPRRIETMERSECAILVPPLRRKRRKALDFGAIDGR